MNNRLTGFRTAVAVTLLFAAHADAATYRVLPSESNVLPGDTPTLSVEVETEAGDNVVDIGYFSFAIDLTLTGTPWAMGSVISTDSILINETDFDDLSSISFGFPQGNQYLNVAGVTTDFIPPTFGQDVGDITWLFDFDLTVPVTAELDDTITITPSEGSLENLIANESFDNVAPQNFQPATLTVVPEPTTAALFVALLGLSTVFSTRRSIRSDEGHH